MIQEIVQKSLALQANAAAQQHRPLGRGTHVKGVCVRAEFEVLDVRKGRDRLMAERLAQGMFATPVCIPRSYGLGIPIRETIPTSSLTFGPCRSQSTSVETAREVIKEALSGKTSRFKTHGLCQLTTQVHFWRLPRF